MVCHGRGVRRFLYQYSHLLRSQANDLEAQGGRTSSDALTSPADTQPLIQQRRKRHSNIDSQSCLSMRSVQGQYTAHTIIRPDAQRYLEFGTSHLIFDVQIVAISL